MTWITPLFFCLGGLIMAYHPMIRSGFSRLQTDPGDTLWNHYVLEHGFRWLRGDALHANLWSPPMFFPEPNTFAYSDVLLSIMPIYAVFRFLGLSENLSYALWMLTLSGLTFAISWIWLRRFFTVGAVAASIGAFLIAFGAPRVVQTGHQQLIAHFYTIGAIAGAQLAFTEQGHRAILGLGLFFCSLLAQAYAGFYWAWFLCTGVLYALVIALALKAYRFELVLRLRRLLPWVLIFGGVSALLASPMAWHYYEASRAVGLRDFDRDVGGVMAQLQSWLYLGPQSWLYFWQPGIRLFEVMGMPHEKQLAIGVAAFTLVIIGFKRNWKKPRIRLFGYIVLAFIVTMTTLPYGLTFWRYLFPWIPGAQAVRALARVGIVLLIPASIGVALGWETLVAKFWPRRRFLVAGVLVFLILEQGITTESFPVIRVQRLVESIRKSVMPDCEAFAVNPRLTEFEKKLLPDYQIELAAIWASIELGIPTLNGYSGNAPPGWGIHTKESMERWLERPEFSSIQVCWVEDVSMPYFGVLLRDSRR